MDNGKKGFKGRGVVHEHYIYGVVHWHTIKYDVVHEYYNGVVHFRNKNKGVYHAPNSVNVYDTWTFLFFLLYKWLKNFLKVKKMIVK